MINHSDIEQTVLIKMIKNKQIQFGGNCNLKIYGTLYCKSGKLMKRENRVFFANQMEAISNGFRPCGHCMHSEYLKWKQLINKWL